jgi:signal transduction histidine kinase
MKGILMEAIKRNDDFIHRTRAEIRYPESLPPALGNGQWIEEVWVNFLSNALKYGGSPPAIQVGADEAGEGMNKFWVKDNGDGVKPESLDMLFKPFTRLNQADIRGFGLGLSITRRIIERLGGSCGVESTGIPGEGSRFWFTLKAPGNETNYD